MRGRDAAVIPGVVFSLLTAVAHTVPAQTTSIEGWINVVWDDVRGGDPDGRTVFVTEKSGRVTRLTGSNSIVDELERRNRAYARVAVEPVDQTVDTEPRRALSITAIANAYAGAAASVLVESKPFITLLCRFADDPSSPATPAEIEAVTGSNYPGVAHFYGEQSQDPSVMSGTRAAGWYTLPLPRSEYIRGDVTDFALLANDCTAAADADVNFPSWYGVNLQLNGELSNRPTAPYDPLSFGGSWTLNRDGQTRVYGMTWMGGSFRKNYMVYSHEMGHALGWPHSSGRYGNEYDSRWDVMSVGYLHFTADFGWLGIHTIASHKDRVGWIPSARKWIPQPAASESRVISRTALPPTNSDMLMAEIRISEHSVYTVEARKIAGYDTPLPGEAVLLHRVDDGRAYVVDPDQNGNPNDAAAMWLPGETFRDEENSLAITVEGETPTGFIVRITRGGGPVSITGSRERTAGVVGVAYADTLVAQGFVAAPAWSVIGGSLPNGLELNSSTGVITGTPSASGRYTYTIAAAADGTSSSLPLALDVFNPVVIAPESVRPPGSIGTPYQDSLTASGGTGSYSWKVVSGSLPTGLSLDTASGRIAGTPATAGSFSFSVSATSVATNRTITGTSLLSAVMYPAVVAVSDSLRPQATMGAPYADTLKASGGSGTFTWVISGGTLPAGLTVDARGIIGGIPTEAGEARLEFTVSSVASVTQVVRISVVKPVIPQEKVIDQLWGSGILTASEIRFLDLIGNRNGRFDLGDVRAWLIDTGRLRPNARMPSNLLARPNRMKAAAPRKEE